MNQENREPTTSLSLIQDAIKQHFFNPARLTPVVTMAKRGIQREHWFDMELETLFSEMKERGAIESWERQCRTKVGDKDGRCDFKIEFADLTAIIEVKVLQQRTPIQKRVSDWTLWSSRNDFGWDIQKMLGVPGSNCHCLLVFAYPDRTNNEWQVFVNEMAYPHIGVSISRVDHSPEGELSIGWLQVSRQVVDASETRVEELKN